MAVTKDIAEIQEIPVVQIQPGDNDREAFDAEGLRELAESIGQHGLAQPITIRPVFRCPRCRTIVTATRTAPYEFCSCTGQTWPPQYQIVAGERRWRAVKLLQWREHLLKVVITPDSR